MNTIIEPIAVPALVRFWHIVLRRKYTVAGVTLGLTAIIAAVVMMLTPIYRSTVTILIEQTKQKVVSVDEVYSDSNQAREFFQTQSEILQSREVAMRVIDKLRLTEHPLFDPRQKKSGLIKKIMSLGRAAPVMDDEMIRSKVLEHLRETVYIEPVRMSQLLKLSVDSEDRNLSAQIANAFAEAYIESDLDARFSMTQRANTWIAGRVKELREKLAESEQKLQEYRDRENLIDARGVVSTAATQMDEVGRRLVEARVRRAEAETAYEQVKSLQAKNRLDFESIPAIVRNQSVATARQNLANADRNLSDMSQRYGREHPKYIQAEAQYKTAKDDLKTQIDVVVASLQKEFEVARATEQALERTMSSARGQIANINRKEFSLSTYEREVSTNKQLYDLFLSRMKETSATGDLQSVVARVVDHAAPSEVPIKPNTQAAIMAGFFASLIAVMMLVYLIDRLDNTYKMPDELESHTGLPLLATLPILEGKGTDFGTFYLNHPKTAYAEGLRTARTNVLLTMADEANKVFAVTSSVPGEGKTTVSINLALAHAQTKPTLLLECDLRRPQISGALNIPGTAKGLVELIAGEATIDEVLYTVPNSTLTVIPSGRLPSSPQELLASNRFAHLIDELRARFEVIVLDSTPINLISDAAVLSKVVSGFVYVVKSGETPRTLVHRGLTMITRHNKPVFGLVLNQHNPKASSSYDGYHSKYEQYGYYN